MTDGRGRKLHNCTHIDLQSLRWPGLEFADFTSLHLHFHGPLLIKNLLTHGGKTQKLSINYVNLFLWPEKLAFVLPQIYFGKFCYCGPPLGIFIHGYFESLGVPFDPSVVFGFAKDFLFKSILRHCVRSDHSIFDVTKSCRNLESRSLESMVKFS